MQETEKILASAFQYKMVSDVPVGVFLSGGYDSNIVTAILQKNNTQKIKTFNIAFEEKQYMKRIMRKTLQNTWKLIIMNIIAAPAKPGISFQTYYIY